MKSKLFLLALILTMFMQGTSCSKNIEKNIFLDVDKNCKSLNDSAILILNNFYMDNDSLKLYRSLALLDSAIGCDSNYFIAYSNKLSILNELKLYNQSIEVINKLLFISKGKRPEIIMFKAEAYKEMGNMELSNKYFEFSENKFDSLLALNPQDINIINYKLYLDYYRYGKKHARKEILKYFPNEKSIEYINAENLIDVLESENE